MGQQAPGIVGQAALAVAVVALLVGVATPPVHAATPRGPTDPGTRPWEQVPPDRVAEECGLDPDLMEQASLQMLHTPFAVVRYGKLCWTGGYPTGSTMPYMVHSITKTVGGVLVGMVAARSDLDDTDPITDWLDEDELGGINPHATVAHVLAMTATKDDLEHGQKGAWSYDTFGDREIDVLVEVMDRAIEREPEAFPGIQDIAQFAQQELFERLGMRDTSWPGQTIAFSMTSTPEDLARLGLLLLRRGVWDGERLLDEDYLYRLTHPAFEDTNTGYGYLTYVNAAENWTYSSGTNDEVCSPFSSWPGYPHPPFFEAEGPNGGTPFEDEPHDIGLVWAAGAGGQRIAVHRGLDLVITVRDEVVSTDLEDPGIFEGHKNVWTKIRPALVAHDPVFAGDEDAFCEAYRSSRHAPDLLDPWSPSASAAGPALAATDERSPVSEDRRDGPAAAAPDDTPEAGTRRDGPPLPVTGGSLAPLALAALVAASRLRRRRRSTD